jgi:hypothetical protein
MSDETAQTANTAQSNDSAPADMPSSAPEAPASEVVSAPVKDDNSIPAHPESQPIDNPVTAQTGEISPVQEPNQEQNSAPKTLSTLSENETDQTMVNEPKVSEPALIFSAPIPTPAEPVSSPVSSKSNLVRDLLNQARQVIQSRKQKKIDRVMDLFAKRTNITNDEVEKFLYVSDATATRYLEILEKKNKIRQSGKTGKAVSYSKI